MDTIQTSPGMLDASELGGCSLNAAKSRVFQSILGDQGGADTEAVEPALMKSATVSMLTPPVEST